MRRAARRAAELAGLAVAVGAVGVIALAMWVVERVGGRAGVIGGEGRYPWEGGEDGD